MAGRKLKVEVPLNLLKLTTDQFFCSKDISYEDIKTEITMSNTIQYGIDASNAIIGCLFKFEIAKDKNILLLIEAGAHFKIDTAIVEKLHNRKKNTFTLPLVTAKMMLTVAIGTARGILHSKTEGTEMNGLFIPLIDLDSALTEDLVVNLTENPK